MTEAKKEIKETPEQNALRRIRRAARVPEDVTHELGVDWIITMIGELWAFRGKP